ncbi:hypothetical protein [Mycobacterium sp.]|uniref:hypothetical protein n=1 Tax=Mycobacterium sp. TaxID=1785 RepID=UPI003BAACAA4
MSATEDEPVEPSESGADPPLTVELLADLQAGLLDDETASRVRSQVRADPQAAGMLRALNQVRRDVAVAGDGLTPGQDVPPGVTARILTALQSASSDRKIGPGHLARPRARPARVAAVVAGLCALAAAIGLGTSALVRTTPPVPAANASVTARHITVSTPAPTLPLSHTQIVALLGQAPDYGSPRSPLADPSRRASCVSGLGYPASTEVLGARPVTINARAGILLILPGDNADELAVFAVAPTCNAADTGLMVSNLMPRG